MEIKNDLISAGLVPDKEKSIWTPNQVVDWLGFTWNCYEGSLKVIQRRVDDIQKLISKLQVELPFFTARKLASFAGKIISLGPVIR